MKRVMVAGGVVVVILAVLAVAQFLVLARDRLHVAHIRGERDELKAKFDRELTGECQTLLLVSDGPGEPPVEGARVRLSAGMDLISDGEGRVTIPAKSFPVARVSA